MLGGLKYSTCRAFQHPGLLAFQPYSTAMMSLLYSHVFCPIPLTFMMSSGPRNGPCVSRYSIIRPAITGPTLFNLTSSSSGAVLMLILLTAACPLTDMSSELAHTGKVILLRKGSKHAMRMIPTLFLKTATPYHEVSGEWWFVTGDSFHWLPSLPTNHHLLIANH